MPSTMIMNELPLVMNNRKPTTPPRSPPAREMARRSRSEFY